MRRTRAHRGTVPTGSLTLPRQQAAASQWLVVIFVIAFAERGSAGGLYVLINLHLSVRGNLLVFPINFSKYKSFSDVILGQLDKTNLVISCVEMLDVGHKFDFFW